jgi:hypothetical protein
VPTPIAHEQISVVTDGRSIVEAYTKRRLPRDFSNSPPSGATKYLIVADPLYAGRLGTCTLTIEATGGNYTVAQALLRHKSMSTTLNLYRKKITPEPFQERTQGAAAVTRTEEG